MTNPEKVIAFDLDGTLIESGNKTHKKSFLYAIEEYYSKAIVIDWKSFHGSTDKNIVLTAIERNSLANLTPSEEDVRKIFGLMDDYVSSSDSQYNLLPGAMELLSHLANKQYPLLLCTGNISSMASYKTKTTNISNHFEFGSYGDNHTNRESLVGDLLSQIQERFPQFVPGKDNTYIVGDTPHDVRSANAHNVSSIGVSTGIYNLEELRAAGADHSVQSLLEIVDILQ